MIVDDHDIFRQSLALLLGQQDGFDVVGHFNSLSHLFEQRGNPDVDCIMLDYHLPDENPLTALTKIKRQWPNTHIVFLTGTRSGAILKRIMESPVQGVLHKSDDSAEIVKILQTLSPSSQLRSVTIEEALDDVDYGLTSKEFDILVLLTQGQTPAEIADTLCLSKRTIEKHKENIMRKTEVHNLAQLIELGHRLVLHD